MIIVKNVSYQYKKTIKEEAIKNAFLEVQDGEFICIIGKNGSGKSTLAKLISGIILPTKGEVLVEGMLTKDKTKLQELRKKIGIVFQNPENQIIFSKVEEDIRFALDNLKILDSSIRIQNALEKVGMSGFENKDTYSLSLGQKQRIAIAGVLAVNPKVIVLDEPTAMIDPEGKEKIYQIIKGLKRSGYTIIYVTNQIEEILLSDRIILMEQGSIKKEFLKTQIIEQVDFLKQSGVKIPLLLEMVLQLRESNIQINIENWTLEEIMEKILELAKRGAK